MLASMNKGEMTVREMASLGGKARAANLSPEARSKIASIAARKRWGVSKHGTKTKINRRKILGEGQ